MLKRDFVEFKEMKKIKSDCFCECCLRANPEMYDGYTVCCNELCINKEDALKEAKLTDILNALRKKYNVSSYGEMNRKVFKFENKEFTLNLRRDIDVLLEEIKANTKGLRGK